MIVVKQKKAVLNTILGTQEIDGAVVYRKISFCFFAEIDGKHVVYNTLTGEIAELEEEEYLVLQGEPSLPSSISEELIKNWYLVPEDHDDIKLCDEIEAFVALFDKRDGVQNYTVFTTTECNARCFYCYEHGCEKLTMDEKTASDVAHYIIKNAPSSKKVNLSWFGGEPLCNFKVIDIISDKLFAAGIDFAASIVSNGYLFNAEISKKAAQKWNIKSVQITLDGTSAVYNATKAYVCGDENAFATVADNIAEMLKNGIAVSIRVNMGSNNKDDLYRLVDYVADRYNGYEKVSVYPRVLMDYDGGKGKNSVSAKEFLEFERYCDEKMLLPAPVGINDAFKVNTCMADSSDSVTVLPNGKIGKCEHFVSENLIGDIYSGIIDTATEASFKERLNSKELCNFCPLYPTCIRLAKCPDVALSPCDSDYVAIENAHLLKSLKYTYRKLKESK